MTEFLLKLEFVMEELYLEEMDFVSGGADYGNLAEATIEGDGVTTSWVSGTDTSTGVTTTMSYAESDTGMTLVQTFSNPDGSLLGSTVTTFTSNDGSSVQINMSMSDGQGNVQQIGSETVHP